MKKRGLSPVVATVLLIALVVVIGLLIVLWMRGMTKEAVTKFDGENIELICEDVDFDASYSAGTLSISNTEGNVPIFDLQIKIQEGSSYKTVNARDYGDEWPGTGLNQGGIASLDISDATGEASKLTLIPILRGSVQSGGQKNHVCEKSSSIKIITI